MKFKFTITEQHVNDKRSPRAAPDRYKLLQCMGRLFPSDIGKRVYETSAGHFQVENDEQLAKRKERERT